MSGVVLDTHTLIWLAEGLYLLWNSKELTLPRARYTIIASSQNVSGRIGVVAYLLEAAPYNRRKRR